MSDDRMATELPHEPADALFSSPMCAPRAWIGGRSHKSSAVRSQFPRQLYAFVFGYLHQQFPSTLSRQRRRPSPPVTRVTPRRVLLPSHTGGLCYLCSAQSGVRSDVVDDHAGYVEKPLTTHPCPQGLEVRKTLLFLLTQILTQKCRR